MFPKTLRVTSNAARFIRAKSNLDTVVQFEWEDGQPGLDTWGNVNFILAETLRAQYEVKNIVRLEFRGIPDTAGECSITAEILAKNPVRLNPVRKILKARKPATRQSAKETVPFVIDDLLDRFPGLDERDKKMLSAFNTLPLPRRIYFWQKFIAPYFQ
ncbi:MAG TPA: hypothetical protein VIH76_01425 [Candidatus Acidoferrales bacterium]